jgi:hypothetical protein
MGKGQEHNNRSQGQRIRYTNERASQLVDTVDKHQELLEQHDRDIKMLKSTVYDRDRIK